MEPRHDGRRHVDNQEPGGDDPGPGNPRCWLDYDPPVASHWPEFAQNGKAAITVRQLLGNEAGFVLLDEELTPEKLAIWTPWRVCSRARSRPGHRARVTATSRCRSGCTCRSSSSTVCSERLVRAARPRSPPLFASSRMSAGLWPKWLEHSLQVIDERPGR